MENQIPPSQAPVQPLQTLESPITPEMLAELKARAREAAVQQTIAQQASFQPTQPKIVYLRRNLTVAELLLVFLISCGIVTGIQWSWTTIFNLLPKIEVRVR